MYNSLYYITKNENEFLSTKSEEFVMFFKYVKMIHNREEKRNDSPLWTDFPYDMYDDTVNWQDKNSIEEIKNYIEDIVDKYPYTKESARLFWCRWLNYKNSKKNK